MKPIIQWIFSLSAGLLMGAQTFRMCKVANEDNESYFAHIMDSSAVQNESHLPYILGSEQISAALQHILSSDENNLENRPTFYKPGYELGSESLNRMLEEIMTNSGSDDNELIHFQPAIQA